MSENESPARDMDKRTVLAQMPTEALEAGMAVAFGADDDFEQPPGQKSILESLSRKVDRVPRVQLKSAIVEESSPILRTKSPEIPSSAPNSRYQLAGEIARGGMGAILKGRDVDLGRDLAIKVLLDSHKDKPEVIERFIEEAQIGGQLQHPGIVPVYELGQFSDQRPFFTMKLVKGKTLSALLAARQSPAEDRAKYLGIFEQICQTMAYAHSRGVIHRDLKPSNVMVGSFGEVQVMDWGLAKVLSEGGVADERKALSTQQTTSIIETIRSQGSDTKGVVGSQTQQGSVLGTPAYMAPEQALGESDIVDQRVDVFGLGAILSEILTGKPPYTGKDATEVFRMASRGKLGDCFERLDKSEAEDDLIALVRDCLAVEPADRLRDAGVLSERITGHLESVDQRLRQAELKRVEANTRAVEERKRRRVVLALAASIIAALCVGGGGWLWGRTKDFELAQVHLQNQVAEAREKNEREQQTRDHLAAAAALNSNISESSRVDPALLARALESIRSAERLLESDDLDPELSKAVVKLREQLEQRHRDHQLIAALHAVWEKDMELLADRESELRDLALSRDESSEQGAGSTIRPLRQIAVIDVADDYERAFAQWGLRPGQTPEGEAVKRIRELPLNLRAIALTSLERWMHVVRSPKLFGFWETADWSTMKSIKRVSRGGDHLELLADGSILASGAHPEFGYDLVYETDKKTISALRLTAIPDDSLPKRGPGRSGSGKYHLKSFRVSIVPKSNQGITFSPEFIAATATNFNPIWPVSTARLLNGHEHPGKEHTVVLELDEPLYDESGFFVHISHADRDKNDPNRRANLGRFQWLTSGSDSKRDFRRWLSIVVRDADDDEYRRKLRHIIASGDFDALHEIASDYEQLLKQPAIVRVELAELIKRQRLSVNAADVARGVDWQPLAPVSLSSERGTVLEQLDDNSILASGPMPQGDTYKLTFAMDGMPITAIWIQFLSDASHFKGRFSRNDGRGHISIGEISIRKNVGPESRSEVPIRVTKSIDQQRNNLHFPISNAFDGDEFSEWLAKEAREDSVVFKLNLNEISESDDELQIDIQTGRNGGLLGRFRILATTDNVDWVDPQIEALAMLRKLNAFEPGDYWGNLSLANLYAQQTPRDWETAIRFATVAIALDPANPKARLCRARLLCSSSLTTKDRFREGLADASRARDLGADEKDLAKLGLQITDIGKSLFIDNKPAFATEFLRAGVDLAPQETTPALWLAWALVNTDEVDQRKPEESIKWAQKALELSPGNNYAKWCLGIAYYRNGNFEAANESLDGIGDQTIGGLRFHMAMVKEKLGDHDSALTLFNDAEIRRVEKSPDDAWVKNVRDEAAAVLGIAQPNTASDEAQEVSQDSAE